MKRLSKLIAKLLVIPVAVSLVGKLIAREPLKIMKEQYWTWERSIEEDRNIRVQWGYSISVNDHEGCGRPGQPGQYHRDREVLYRKVGQEWLREEGYWKAMFGEPAPDEPCPLTWIIESAKKVSEKEVPIYVKSLYELWIDNDPGEISALATIAFTKPIVFDDGTPGHTPIEPNKRELRHLDKQANKWVREAVEYYK